MGFLAFERWLTDRKARVYTRLVGREFGSIGDRSIIYPPFHSNNPGGVHIGRHCLVWPGGWLDTFDALDHPLADARIEIGDHTYLGFRSHIIACHRVTVGKHVLVANQVHITDNMHGFEDISRPVLAQPIRVPGPVVIEDEVWLGESVCVLPNVTIGRHSVIGSNAVVTRDIPAYSVAVGVPARVIKRYDPETQQWVRQ